MIKEGRKLAAIADNVAVKVPMTEEGLMACKALSDAGTMVNVTLCFSSAQAILAAKAGATFVSPFFLYIPLSFCPFLLISCVPEPGK